MGGSVPHNPDDHEKTNSKKVSEASGESHQPNTIDGNQEGSKTDPSEYKSRNALDDLIFEDNYHSEWVVTFSDLITVLLVFFVILQATSTFSPTKFHEAMTSIERVFKDVDTTKARIDPPPPLLLAPPEEEAIPGQGLFEVSINSGFFRYSSGMLGEMRQEEGMHHTILKTPTAKMGVRGSVVEGHVASNGATTFIHRSGILHVSDPNGENVYKLDTPGQAIHYEPGEPFPAMKDQEFGSSTKS